MRARLDAKRVAEIRSSLETRHTVDLLEIWQTRDTGEWSPEAFEAIRLVLKERLGSAPRNPASAAWKRALELRAQRLLDQAKVDEEQGQFEKALEHSEAALQIAPHSAKAHHYRGLLLDAMGRLIPAMREYEQAIHLDPKLTEARDDLRAAERDWIALARTEAVARIPAGKFASEDDVPETLYLSKVARLVSGWPGHRTRPKRSGFDPLDTDFEFAHVRGVLLRQMFTGQLRMRNPIYLFLIGFIGLSWAWAFLLVALDLANGHLDAWPIVLAFAPYGLPGLALLWNVALSVWAIWSGEEFEGL